MDQTGIVAGTRVEKEGNPHGRKLVREKRCSLSFQTVVDHSSVYLRAVHQTESPRGVGCGTNDFGARLGEGLSDVKRNDRLILNNKDAKTVERK